VQSLKNAHREIAKAMTGFWRGCLMGLQNPKNIFLRLTFWDRGKTAVCIRNLIVDTIVLIVLSFTTWQRGKSKQYQ